MGTFCRRLVHILLQLEILLRGGISISNSHSYKPNSIMTPKLVLKLFPIHTRSLIKRMVIGGAIGLAAISLFLYGGDPDPAWSKYWWIRPIVIVPLAGAMGGAFNYLVSRQNFQTIWLKVFAMILSLIVFLVGLWLGTVLGLDGTYWD
jgi:hypothetical protein